MANEKRLIDANEMKNNIMEAMMRQFEKNGDQIALRIAEMMWHFIDETDTVDAVEVVRCENCQYWNPRYETMGMCMKHNSIVTFTKPNFYCAWGERKNDGICEKG